MKNAQHAATVKWRSAKRGRMFWGTMSALSLLGVFGGTAVHQMLTPAQESLGGLSLYVLLWVSLLGLSVSDRDPGAKEKKPRQGTVFLDEYGLHYQMEEGGAGLVQAHEIETGWLEPGSDVAGATLVLRMHRGRELCIEMARREAEELLAVLGGDARVVRMPLVADPRWVRGCAGMFIAWFVASGGMMLAIGLMLMLQAHDAGVGLAFSGLMTAGMMMPLRHFMVPAKIEVGSEGLVLRRFLKRKLYVPFSELVSATAAGAYLGLKLKGGSHLAVRASPAAAKAVSDTVAQRKKRFELSHDEQMLTMLRQGVRSTDDWRTALSSLLTEKAQDYRRAPVEPEQIMAVLDDPSAAPEQRVAAAYALAQAADDQARPTQGSYQDKIRIVADGVASPKLRIALERAADGDLDRQALSEAEAQLQAAQSQKRVSV